MRKWSTYNDFTDVGPATFIKLEIEGATISVPVLFTAFTKQTFRERIIGVISYLEYRACDLERIRAELESAPNEEFSYLAYLKN